MLDDGNGSAYAGSLPLPEKISMPSFLQYDQQDHVVTLTMNEPERRNPLTGNSAVQEFLAAIDRIHAEALIEFPGLQESDCDR